MTEKTKRNDPCPCGSGKKYKQCCISKSRPKTLKTIKASVIQSGATKQPPDLMNRAFGNAIKKAEEEDAPPLAPSPSDPENKE